MEVLRMGGVTYGRCYVWEVLRMGGFPYGGVTYGGVTYGRCYVWEVGKCYVWEVGKCYVWKVLCMGGREVLRMGVSWLHPIVSLVSLFSGRINVKGSDSQRACA